ncbi:MAG: hypothetical protein AMXMBFR7_39600 [Planctomycetota bacterium]
MQTTPAVALSCSFEPPSGHVAFFRLDTDLVVIEPCAQRGTYWVSGCERGANFFRAAPVAAADLESALRASAPFAFDPHCEVSVLLSEPLERSWAERRT